MDLYYFPMRTGFAWTVPYGLSSASFTKHIKETLQWLSIVGPTCWTAVVANGGRPFIFGYLGWGTGSCALRGRAPTSAAAFCSLLIGRHDSFWSSAMPWTVRSSWCLQRFDTVVEEFSIDRPTFSSSQLSIARSNSSFPYRERESVRERERENDAAVRTAGVEDGGADGGQHGRRQGLRRRPRRDSARPPLQLRSPPRSPAPPWRPAAPGPRHLQVSSLFSLPLFSLNYPGDEILAGPV